MKRFLLFIRDDGRDDIATIHPDEASARADLATYVRQRTGALVRGNAADEGDAIRACFGRGTAMYVVARVATTTR